MTYDDLGLEPVERLSSDERMPAKSYPILDPGSVHVGTPGKDDLDERLLRIIRALDR